MKKLFQIIAIIIIFSFSTATIFAQSTNDKKGPGRQQPDRSSRPSIDAPNAQKKQEKSEYLNYLGERKSISNEELCAKKIKCSTLTDNYIAIEIYFNQSINPSSVKTDSISINQKKISPQAKIIFNKNADIMTIRMNRADFDYLTEAEYECIRPPIEGELLPPPPPAFRAEYINYDSREFVIEIKNVSSFDGKKSNEEIDCYFEQ